MNAAFAIPASRLMATMTLTVNITGLRAMRARIAIGVWLIKLATRVIGCKLELEGR